MVNVELNPGELNEILSWHRRQQASSTNKAEFHCARIQELEQLKASGQPVDTKSEEATTCPEGVFRWAGEESVHATHWYTTNTGDVNWSWETEIYPGNVFCLGGDIPSPNNIPLGVDYADIPQVMTLEAAIRKEPIEKGTCPGGVYRWTGYVCHAPHWYWSGTGWDYIRGIPLHTDSVFSLSQTEPPCISEIAAKDIPDVSHLEEAR